MLLILAGVGTALYTLTVLLELLVEGHLGHAMEKRRMDKRIAALNDHAIVCGWGRVGRGIARELEAAGKALVVVDNDSERTATIHGHPHPRRARRRLLRQAGIGGVGAVAAVSTDPGLFITMSAVLRPEPSSPLSRARRTSQHQPS
jgi:voltage-gated potassium channel